MEMKGKGILGAGDREKMLNEIKSILQRLEKISPEKAKIWRKQLETNLETDPGRLGMMNRPPGDQQFRPDLKQTAIAMNNRVIQMSDFDDPWGPLSRMS